jgi:cyclopropane fatty-acyl-phospholipid synthase-like methyltransferase
VIDRAPVVAIARRRARASGLGARVTAISGRAQSAAWGGPYDLILMINVLEYFTDGDRQTLLRKARAALRPGGSLVMHSPMLNDRLTGPPEAVAYDLMLMALGAGGGAMTFRDLKARCQEAGFKSVTRTRRLPMVIAVPGASPLRAPLRRRLRGPRSPAPLRRLVR